MKTYERIREIRNKHYPPKLEFGCELQRYAEKRATFRPDRRGTGVDCV